MRKLFFTTLLILGFGLISQSANADENDYPTVAIADYVFACMASNGQSRQMLEKCSCSIDVIASQLTHQQYIEAETILRMRLLGGEKTAVFRTGVRQKAAVEKLRRAQAESEIICF